MTPACRRSHPSASRTWVLGLGLVGLLTGCAQNDLSNRTGSTTTSGGAPSVSLDRSTVTLQSVTNSGTLPSVNLVATYSGDKMVVGVPAGTPSPTWLSVSTNSLTPGRVVYILAATTTAMTAGTYTTTLRFSTARADGSGATYKDLPVTYTLTAALVAEGATPILAPAPEPEAPKVPADLEAFAQSMGIGHILWASETPKP